MKKHHIYLIFILLIGCSTTQKQTWVDPNDCLCEVDPNSGKTPTGYNYSLYEYPETDGQSLFTFIGSHIPEAKLDYQICAEDMYYDDYYIKLSLPNRGIWEKPTGRITDVEFYDEYMIVTVLFGPRKEYYKPIILAKSYVAVIKAPYKREVNCTNVFDGFELLTLEKWKGAFAEKYPIDFLSKLLERYCQDPERFVGYDRTAGFFEIRSHQKADFNIEYEPLNLKDISLLIDFGWRNNEEMVGDLQLHWYPYKDSIFSY